MDDISLDAWVSDVETVVDAIGLERFPLLGISQGSAISIAYAVRHPERVSHLILYGGFALGANKCSGADKAQRQAMVTLMRLGWGLYNSAFRQMFASMFIPEGTKEQSDWFNELHRKTTSPDCAARYFDRAADIDIRDLLPRVTTPTLVMHARDELVAPFELGRQMAAEIPRARFIALIYKVMTFDLTDEETAVLLGSSAL